MAAGFTAVAVTPAGDLHAEDLACPAGEAVKRTEDRKKKQLEQLRAQLAKAQRAYGEKALANPERQRPTMRGFKIAHGQLAGEIRRLCARREELAAEIRELPKRVPLRQLLGDQDIVRLEQQRKVITDRSSNSSKSPIQAPLCASS